MNDLYEDLISTIPNNRRTSTIINEFKTIVKRFVELRKSSSKFDKYGNVVSPIIHEAHDVPMADYLSEFKNSLYWLKFGVINQTKLFPKPLDSENNMSSIQQLFQKYSKNSETSDQNKYHAFYNSLNKISHPFETIDADKIPNVFQKPNGLIISAEVNENINVINNNEDGIKTEVINNDVPHTGKFVFQQLNTGLDWLEPNTNVGNRLTGMKNKTIGKLTQMTPNDQININSVFMFPEPVVRFSSINLPEPNVLVKSNLNTHFINYFQLVKSANVNKIVLDNLETQLEITASDEDYLNDEIKQFSLNLTSYDEGDVSKEDIFKYFIKFIIPTTTHLFKLVQKYINGALSPQSAISYLEPFMIYSNNLTFTQYKIISEFVKNKIIEYNDTFAKFQEIFDIIRNKKNISNRQSSNSLFQLLDGIETKSLISSISKNNQSEWTEHMSTKYNRPYWVNANTGKSVWEKPTELKENAEPELKIDFLNENVKDKVLEMYNLKGNKLYSSSEILKQLILLDNVDLYNILIAYTNLKLMFSNRMNKLFESEKEVLKQIMDDDRIKNTCNNYVICKKYYSMNKLLSDDDVDVYFDKEYDTTDYDIIDNKFKKEQSSMNKDEFRTFLISELKKIYKLSPENAEYLAETLTNGLKRVLNGQYAILSTKDVDSDMQIMEYYVRQNNSWEKSNDVNLSSFVTENDLLCNINYDCLYDNNIKGDDKCVSNSLNEDNIIEKQFKGILDQFDSKYEFSLEELKQSIENKIVFNKNKFEVIFKYSVNEELKYNNIAHRLGQSLNKDELITTISPYAELRDLILGQNDFAKKQQNIISFVEKYCRRGNPTSENDVIKSLENEWWFYCLKSNAQLLPYFRYELAKVFLENPSEYDNTIQKLIKEIGKQSDSGDSWVDKHSGEMICKIDFDISEGFSDGFANKSNSVIAEDIGEIVAERMVVKEIVKTFKSDKNTIYVYEIISKLETEIGVKLTQQMEFLLKIGTSLLKYQSSDKNGILLTEKEYDEKKKKHEAKEKTSKSKMPSYELYYSVKVLYVSIGLFAIGLQTTIPSVKTRKLLRGCEKSFDGFPIGGSENMEFMKYISCAVRKMKQNTVPWIAVDKDETKIMNMIVQSIEDNLMPNIEIKTKMLKKIEYLNNIKTKNIPSEYNVTNWHTFLPPLKTFHISSSNKDTVSSNFISSFNNDVLNGKNTQESKINYLNAKIIYQSLAIQEKIQQIVEKKDLMMKSSSAYFNVNSCCNDMNNATALQYFLNESPEIGVHNKQVNDLSIDLRRINYLAKPSIFVSTINTKLEFPVVSNIIDEEIIYRGFIHFCKFNTLGALSNDILSICIDKPKFSGRGKSIQEQIFLLKKEGRNYELDDFLKLYKIVSKNNILNIYIGKNEPPNYEFNEYLNTKNKKGDNLNDDNVYRKIVDKCKLLINENYYEQHTSDTSEMKNMKNTLRDESDKLINDITSFMSRYINSSKQNKIIKNFFSNLKFENWEFNKTIKNTLNNANNISNDKLNNYAKYMSNLVDLFGCVLPVSIINSNTITTIPHKYWKLSQSHRDSIVELTSKFYFKLTNFYMIENLNMMLKSISKQTEEIQHLAKLTPISTNIVNNGTSYKKSFDEDIIAMLYEFYVLYIFKIYIMSTKLNTSYMNGNNEYIEISENDNSKIITELFVVYIEMMTNLKRLVNISYESVNDEVFSNRELEKYLFTDRLKQMTQEERDIDTMNKKMGIGMYALGETKALRFYDQDQFEEDKKRNEKMAILERKMKGNNTSVDNVDLDDAEYEDHVNDEEDEEFNLNMSEEYDDGDPYGDERDEDDRDYD